MSKVALRVYNREIETLIDQGHLEEAIAHCQHILKIYPKHLESYRLLGKAYLESRRHNDAADIFQRVIASVPDDFVSQLGMSIVRDEQKDLDGAIWHMERAYEVNPSNGAVQGELRRLYGRRDGMEPPKIRLTRGALAQMYAKGGQYQQAIAEIKSVLSEDPTRLDMRILMARALYRGGQKTEATDICMDLLKQSPFFLDANRILLDVLPGNQDVYRKRIEALEPYATQAKGSTFELDTIPDNAITIDRLDWDPSATGSTSAGSTTKANDALPDFLSGTGWGPSTGEFQDGPVDFGDDEPSSPAANAAGLAAADIPDWLKAMAPPGASAAIEESDTASSQNVDDADLDWLSGLGGPIASATSQPAAPKNDQPDWLTDLGGADSAASFEPQSTPQNTSSNNQPDWLNDLGAPTGDNTTAAATDDSLDWLQTIHETPPAPTAAQPDVASAAAQDDDADMDWLQNLGLPQETAPSASVPNTPQTSAAEDNEDMDWLQGLGLPQTESPSAASTPASQPLEQPAADDNADMDWLQGLGLPQTESPSASAPESQPVEQSAPSADIADADMDWLKNLGAPQAAPAAPVPQTPPAAPPPQPIMAEKKKFAQDDPNFVPPPLSELVSGPGTSESEQDDAMKWLEALAAKQGAKAEELITKPEDRTHDAPTWVAPTVEQPAAPVAQTPPPAPEPPVEKKKFAQDDPNFVPPPLSELVSGPGTSESEQDDAMKWLEALAAKQGAKAEELITKPEDRTHDAPTWVAPTVEQPAAPAAPVAQTPPPAPEPPVEKKKFAQDDPNFVPPPLSELVSGPGTSESEQDDAMKWLEALAAKQGAKAEELITKPEDRTHDAPTWVAPTVEQPAAPVAQTPPPAPEPPVEKKKFAQDDPNFVPPPLSELVSGPGTSESEQDDAMKWLEALAAKQGAKAEELITKPEDRTHDAPTWVAPTVEQPAAPVAQTPPPAPEPPVEKKKFAQDDPNFVPPPLSELVSGPGTSESEQDDAMKWLEALAAKQGAKAEELITKPEDRTHDAPTWVAPTTEESAVPAGIPASFDQPTVVQKRSIPQEESIPATPPVSESTPGISHQEQDDAMKWLEALANNQPALAEEPSEMPAATTSPTDSAISASEQDDAMKWLESLAGTQATAAETPASDNAVPDWASETMPMDLTPTPSQPEPIAAEEDTMAWLQNLAANEPVADQAPIEDEEVPASSMDFSAPVEPMPWEQEESAAQPVEKMPWEEEELAAPVAKAEEPADVSAWLQDLDAQDEPPTTPAPVAAAPVAAAPDAMPDWMNSKQSSAGSDDDLPDWLKDSSGDEQPGSPMSTPEWVSDTDETAHLIFSPPLEKTPPPPPPAPAPVPAATRVPTTPLSPPPPPQAPVRPAVRQTGMLGDKDGPALQNARQLMAHGSMDAAINGYTKLIKRSKFLEEVIYDLKEATYSHPVDAIIWQTLGDAHMRANQLQDALDAYTRAEELIR